MRTFRAEDHPKTIVSEAHHIFKTDRPILYNALFTVFDFCTSTCRYTHEYSLLLVVRNVAIVIYLLTRIVIIVQVRLFGLHGCWIFIIFFHLITLHEDLYKYSFDHRLTTFLTFKNYV